ncbi:MAG: hypothetical protein ACE5GZ_08425 [Gammaproteobacteria bacterium]
MKNIITMPQEIQRKKALKNKYMFDFQEEREELTKQRLRIPAGQDWLNTSARSAAVLLLFFGLWAGSHVLLEALQLYRDPVKIETLAIAIERGSNIDKALAPTDETAPGRESNFRLSYFSAWIIALMLLLFISMIAFSAIRTGGKLVVYAARGKRIVAETAMEKERDESGA